MAGEAVRQGIRPACRSLRDRRACSVTRIARGMAADLERSNYKEGCPIATTALETSAQSGGARHRDAYRVPEMGRSKSSAGWSVSACAPDEADPIATMVLSQLEGALLLARTYRSLEPILRAEQALKILLRAGHRNEPGGRRSRSPPEPGSDLLRCGLGQMVPRKGLEPSRPLSHWHLKPARLPIPPPGPGAG